ncbi:unnamed protein product [Heligmosomoides polygyrus]|uniref:DUF1758 domain-containing protein n=1 Tax=Heligmosomoides polygyrus TaxID=6339 RepID=A0A3P8B5B6_HELPZ|nr:unnamed protein product [Heligmosomoides polygyrus]
MGQRRRVAARGKTRTRVNQASGKARAQRNRHSGCDPTAAGQRDFLEHVKRQDVKGMLLDRGRARKRRQYGGDNQDAISRLGSNGPEKREKPGKQASAFQDPPSRKQRKEQHFRQRSQQPAQSHRSQVHFSEQLPTESTTPNLSELAATLHVSQSTKIVKPPLMCTDVVLFNPTNTDKEVCVPVLLDTGASQSYITNDLATVLQLRTSSPQEITMFTFGNDEPISMQATNHEIGIRCINNATAILHVQALPILTTELKYSSFQETNDAKNQPVRKKIATPQLLIGMDYFCDLVFHDNFSISLLKNGYRVLETRIGKIVTDHSLRFNNSNITIINYSSTLSSPARHTDLVKLVERFWTHESMGIIDQPDQSINEQCLDDFNSSIRYNPKERSWKATKYPGFTFCKASCPGFMCGCFFFSPSCLFYKYYAAPTSNITYTIFTCPVWELTVAAEMTQQPQQEKQTHPVTLTPGRATRINDVTLSLIATISPQLPLLTSTFITDGSKTAMTMKVQANELTPATPAQLQCSSESEAKNFKCRFASRACSCSTGPYKATCTCPEGEVSKYLRENLLPLTTKNVMIENYADTIAAHTQVGSALQVHINMDNVKIVSIQNHATCSIESSSLEGCYSCLLGARVTIVCYSTEKTTTADIICGQQQQITTCTETGKLSEVIFHFNTPTVSTRCTVSCPGGNTSFHLSGVLIYVSESELQNEISTINDFSVNQPAGFTAAIKGVSSFFRKLDFSPLTNLLTLLNLIKLIVFSSVLTVIVLLMTSVTSNLSKLKRSY